MSDALIEPGQAELLEWFVRHSGEVVNFPEPLPDGRLLVSRPKGIYKPRGWRHALSIRVMKDSPYPDGKLRFRDDGTWFFNYHQEHPDPASRDSLYTNLALLACIEDRVSVGVLVQLDDGADGRSRYQVLGLALPTQWRLGYFLFEGPADQILRGGDIFAEVLEADAEEVLEADPAQPIDEYDERRRVVRQIVARRGQREFRSRLLDAYGGCCAITGCDAQAVLEAAHLIPYRGPNSNSPENGLLLRADIHTLLDLQLLSVRPDDLTVVVSASLTHTHYATLEGALLRRPSGSYRGPGRRELEFTYAAFQEAELSRSND